ncbi:MAG: DUF72 domain-containing protein [Bacteroidales bacterium]
MKISTGCSGFHYKDWKGVFYPGDIAEKDFLKYYAEKFNSVEINNTFYKVPSSKTLKSWVEETPRDFTFTLKGSRYITHMKKLNDPEEHLEKFMDSTAAILGKTRCILWQLPGNQHKDMDKLKNFVEKLSGDIWHVFEFRHVSWYDEDVKELLTKKNMVFCSVSCPLQDIPDDVVVTSGICYVRMHGVKNWYDYNYSEKQLRSLAEKIKGSGAREAFIYFNNDVKARAPANAIELEEILKKG